MNNFAICSIRSILSSIFALFSFSLKSKSIATLHSLRHCPTSNFKRSGLPDATRFLLFHFFSIGLFLVCQIFPSFKQYQIPCSLSRNLIFSDFSLATPVPEALCTSGSSRPVPAKSSLYYSYFHSSYLLFCMDKYTVSGFSFLL